MFSLIWRFFPGPGWLRLLVMLVVAVALVWLLMFVVFPEIQALIPDPLSGVEDPNVQSE